jgi:hypothetical protein
MIMKLAVMRVKPDWDAVLAAFDLLNWEGGARLPNWKWMGLRCNTRRDGVHVVAGKVSNWWVKGNEETYFTRLRHTASIGLRKVKILRCISGGTPRKGIVL